MCGTTIGKVIIIVNDGESNKRDDEQAKEREKNDTRAREWGRHRDYVRRRLSRCQSQTLRDQKDIHGTEERCRVRRVERRGEIEARPRAQTLFRGSSSSASQTLRIASNHPGSFIPVNHHQNKPIESSSRHITESKDARRQKTEARKTPPSSAPHILHRSKLQ